MAKTEAFIQQLDLPTDNSGQGLFTSDAFYTATISVDASSHTVTSWDKQASLLTGFLEEDVIGKPLQSFMPATSAEHINKILLQLSTPKQSKIHALAADTNHELTLKKSNSSSLELQASISVLKDKSGLIETFILTLKDLAPFQLYHSQIENQQKLFSEVQQLIKAGSWKIHLTDQSIVWDESLFNIHNVSHRVFVPTLTSICELIHPDDKDSFKRYFEAVCANREVGELELRIIHLDGKIRYIKYNRIKKFDDNTYIHGIVEDFTEQKLAEIELQQYKQVVDGSSDSTILVDEQGVIRLVNEAFLRIRSKKYEEVVGHNFKELIPESYFEENVLPKIKRSLNGETVTLQRWDNAVREGRGWVSITYSPYRDINNNITGAVIRAHDITENKVAQEELLRSQNRLVQAQRIAHIGHWNIDLSTNRMEVSDEFFRIYGIKRENFNHQVESLDAVIHPEDLDKVLKAKKSLFSEGSTQEMEYRLITPDGELRYVKSQREASKGQDGSVNQIMGTIIDITQQKITEEALRKSEKRYRSIYNDYPTTFLNIDRQGTILSVNTYGAKMLGYTCEELRGQSIEALYFKEDIENAKKFLEQCFDQSPAVHYGEFRKTRRDGSTLWSREIAKVVLPEENKPIALLVCEDITETKKLSEQLSYQASHDELTKLINRREFERRLCQLLEKFKEDPDAEHVLCYLDMDQFKLINDTCGHIAGDELLKQVSGILQSNTRSTDTLARLGGDEFALLMKSCPLRNAEVFIEKLRLAISDLHYSWEDRIFTPTFSIGVVAITKDSSSYTEIMQQADTACYVAKNVGRNRIHVHHIDDVEMELQTGKMQWVEKINRALREDLFCLHTQTIKPLMAENEVGEHYEILLRMWGENEELISPMEFMDAAESFDLLPKIDRWVIDKTFSWLQNNSERLDALACCSINLSGSSIGEAGFLDYIESKIREKNIPAEKICFEITETAAIKNLVSAIHLIKSLKKLGCLFALDDFGSGLSSFAYLKNLPVDYLKIDGMFVKDIEVDPIDFAMVKSINEIGKVMQKKTIAEFVESEAILEKLKEIGVDYAQGYHLGRPEPLEPSKHRIKN